MKYEVKEWSIINETEKLSEKKIKERATESSICTFLSWFYYIFGFFSDKERKTIK